jgi:hypothetical protein
MKGRRSRPTSVHKGACPQSGANLPHGSPLLLRCPLSPQRRALRRLRLIASPRRIGARVARSSSVGAGSQNHPVDGSLAQFTRSGIEWCSRRPILSPTEGVRDAARSPISLQSRWAWSRSRLPAFLPAPVLARTRVSEAGARSLPTTRMSRQRAPTSVRRRPPLGDEVESSPQRSNSSQPSARRETCVPPLRSVERRRPSSPSYASRRYDDGRKIVLDPPTGFALVPSRRCSRRCGVFSVSSKVTGSEAITSLPASGCVSASGATRRKPTIPRTRFAERARVHAALEGVWTSSRPSERVWNSANNSHQLFSSIFSSRPTSFLCSGTHSRHRLGRGSLPPPAHRRRPRGIRASRARRRSWRSSTPHSRGRRSYQQSRRIRLIAQRLLG